jgi:hypothetical protein
VTLPDLDALARRLTSVDGIVGVVLGGSRARGEQSPESDVDLGLYYRGDLDIAALGAIARDVAGPDAQVTQLGEWGPWVDGGGWLVIEGVHVDWLYRGVDRVRDAWARTHRGSYDWNSQAGHPLGVPDFAYIGELALGVILADPTGELSELRAGLTYPDALRSALARSLWEADFLLEIAAKAVARADTAYIALCLSRVMLVCAHSLHGHDRRWLVNEKGAIASAGRLPCAPTNFERRVCDVLGRVGVSPDELRATLDTATALVEDVKAVWTSET